MTDKEAMRRLAQNVTALRKDAGMSMSELARRIDDYPATIKRIEDKVSQPGVGLLTRLAEALDVGLDDLVAESPAKILSRVS